MCRNKIHHQLTIDQSTQDLIKANIPKTYKVRLEQLKNQGRLFADQMKVDFVVGNRVQIVEPGKKFRWTTFVRLDDPVGLGLNSKNII